MTPKHLMTIIFLAVLSVACKDDESVSCVTCSQSQTLDFTLCEEGDGNASVNGQNTGVPYSIYLNDLLEEGVNCGSN